VVAISNDETGISEDPNVRFDIADQLLNLFGVDRPFPTRGSKSAFNFYPTKVLVRLVSL